MKKTLKLIVTAMLVLALAMSFMACGGEAVSDDGSNFSAAEVPEEKKESAGVEPDAEAERNAEVEAYVEANREEVKSVTEEGFEISLEARGDAVVYVFRYENIKNSPELAAALETEHKNNESTFTDVLAGMKAECPAVGAVIYEYLDSEGELIYSFTAK